MRAPQHKPFAQDSLRRLCKVLLTCSDAKIYHLPLMRNNIEVKQPIQFILKCPDEGVICPITQEPITSPIPDGSLPFDLDHPNRIAIRLACQHDFSAFWLLFNWVHNNHVKCPLCRAGPLNSRLNVALMPHHIRVPLQQHMRRLKQSLDTSTFNISIDFCAARLFVETVAGDSFLENFSEQAENDFIDRLGCTKIHAPNKLGDYGMFLFLSPSKSREAFGQFIRWVRCDPVKYTPSWNSLDLTKLHNEDDSSLPLSVILQFLDHVLITMYGLSITPKFDRIKHVYYYTVFNPNERLVV